MSELGKLWFSLGVKDDTGKDYDNIEKKIRERLKKTSLDVEVNPKVNMEALERAFAKANAGGFTNGVEQAIKGIDQLNVSAEKLARSLERIKSSGGTGLSSRGGLDIETRNLEKITSALHRIDTLRNRIVMNSQYTGGGAKYDEALRKIEQLRAAIISLNKADTLSVRTSTGSGFTAELNSIRLLVQEQEKLNNIQRRNNQKQNADATRQAAREQRELARAMGETNNKLYAQGRLAGELKNQLTGYLSIYGAERFLSSLIQVGGEFEKQKIALRSILGDATKAETIFSQIKTLAVESPFEFKNLASYTKQLSAFAIPYEELYDTTKRLADISAGLGVDMGRIILAYGQVRSAAFLRGTELRQFTEAGIPLVDELAKKFEQLEGRVVSSGEVFERISKRMVSFDMVKQVLWDLTNEGGKFYNMQEELAASLAGRWSNLRDSYDIMLSKIAEGNNGPLKASLELLTGLMNNWRTVASILGTLVTIYGSYKAAVIATNVVNAISAIRANKMAGALAIASKALTGNVEALKGMNVGTAKTIALVEKLKMAISSIGKAGWIGIAIGLFASLGVAIYKANREANRLNRELEEIGDKADTSVTVAVAGFKSLADSLGRANAGSKERADIIDKINTRYGEYLPNLIKETDSNEAVASSIDKVTEAIKRKIQAQAYEQGMQKINEEYSGRLRDESEYLKKRARVVFDIDKSVANKFVEDLKDRISSELGDHELYKELTKLASMYGLSAENINRAYAFNVPFSKAVKTYRDVLKKMRDEEEKFTDSVNRRYEGVGLFADKLKEIEERYQKSMPSDTEEAKAHQIKMLSEQLQALGDEDDAYLNRERDNIRARIAELNKETAAWIKHAEKLGRTKESIGGRDVMTSDLIPKEDERGNVIKFLERVGEEYVKIKKEIASLDGLLPHLIDENSANKLDTLRFQLKQMESFASFAGVDLSSYSKSGAKEINDARKKEARDAAKEAKKEAQEAINRLKEEADAIERAWKLYRRLHDLTGNREEAMRAAFGGEVSFKNEVDQLRSRLKEELNKSGSKITIDELLGMGDKQLENDHGSVAPLVKKIKDATTKISEDELLAAAGMVNKYRDYEDKIVEVKRKANDDIRKLEAQRAKFGDEMTDKAIAKREREEKSDVLKLKFEQFKNSPEYLRSFDDLSKTSTGTLEYLLGQLEKFKGEAAESFDPTNMKEFLRVIDSIMDELTSRDPFGNFIENLDEVNKATQRMRQAQLTIKYIKSGQDNVMSMADAMKMLDDATNGYLEKRAKLNKSVAAVADLVDDLSGSMKELGDTMGGTAGDVLTLMGDIGTFATTSVKGIVDSIKAVETAATAGERAVATIESASVILKVISMSLQVMDKIRNAFNNREDEERYARWLQTITDTQDAYNRKLFETKMLQDDVWGTKKLLNVLNATSALEDATDRYNQKLNEQQKAWKDPKSSRTRILSTPARLIAKELQGDNDETVALKDNLRYITKTRKKGFLGIGGRHTKTQDLNDWVKENLDEAGLFLANGRLNLEVAEALLENADNLAGQTEANLKSLVEIEKQIQEAEQALNDYISDTFGSLGSGLGDSIVEAFRNGTSAAESFRESVGSVLQDLAKQMIMTNIFQGMFDASGKELQEAYKDYGKLKEQGLDKVADAAFSVRISDIMEKLIGNVEEGIPAAESILKMLETAAKLNGIEMFPKNGQNTALLNSISGITEDADNLLASYVNAIRADVSIKRGILEKFFNDTLPRVNLLVEAQLRQLEMIAANTSRNADAAEEIKELFRRVTTPGGVKLNV